MVCKNCGAAFDDNAPKCPYCGQMNYQGAEKKYKKDLGKIHRDLGQLAEKPKEEYAKKSVSVLKRVLIVVALCLIAVLCYFIYSQAKEAGLKEKQRQQLMWEDENFPQLDQWYEAGEYDRILEFQYQLYDEVSPFDIYSWKHFGFLGYYRDYNSCRQLSDMVKEQKECSEYILTEGLWSAMVLAYENTDSSLDSITTKRSVPDSYQLTLEDRERVDQYREFARELLFDTLQFTEDEAQQLYDASIKDGYMTYRAIAEYADTVKSRLYP